MAIYKLVSDKLLRCLQDLIGAIKCSLGKPNGIATLDSTGNVPISQLGNAGGGGAGVSSFNSRTGVVVPLANDYTFAQLASKPTTVSGYGISDAVTLTGTQTLSNKTITGYQQSITLTTTGSSGASTLVGNTLNIPQYSGGSTFSTTQYMLVVGGANNFSGITGSPTPPIAGATTLVDSGLTGFLVRVVRGGIPLLAFNPGDGTSYYTKVKASNTLTFSFALVAGEQIIVETLQ